MKDQNEIHIDHDKVMWSKIQIGYLFRAEGQVWVNITGVICRDFASQGIAVLWIMKNIKSFIPKFREWKLNHIENAGAVARRSF